VNAEQRRADWIGPLILFTAGHPAWTPDHEADWWSVTDDAGNLIGINPFRDR
jgi:hypothetical protein